MGEYDYAFLFKPNIPFMRKSRRSAPFFGLNDRMPYVGPFSRGNDITDTTQSCLGSFAWFSTCSVYVGRSVCAQRIWKATHLLTSRSITPPIIIAGQGGANLDPVTAQYLVSTSLIVCGILSAVQITRFHIYKTPYYLGTGLISVVGTSFAIIPVATGGLAQMYANGMCPTAADGTRLPCPDGYGALLGTASLCALLEIGLSFMTPNLLKKLFPPIITGSTVALIGVSLIQSALEGWAGGSGTCSSRPTTGDFMLCPSNSAPHALPWGSAEFIGLGFSVFVTIILCERFGSPIMKSTSVVLGLLTGCIIAGATGYFDKSTIDAAPSASFIWVHTFKLSVYAPLILPMLAVYLILMMEAIGDITATCDVSRLQVEGKLFDSRIQGGILADGLNGMLAGLCTITPMSTFVSNPFVSHDTSSVRKLITCEKPGPEQWQVPHANILDTVKLIVL